VALVMHYCTFALLFMLCFLSFGGNKCSPGVACLDVCGVIIL